jgi:hypothetical protein
VRIIKTVAQAAAQVLAVLLDAFDGGDRAGHERGLHKRGFGRFNDAWFLRIARKAMTRPG